MRQPHPYLVLAKDAQDAVDGPHAPHIAPCEPGAPASLVGCVLTVLYLARGRPSSSNVCNTNDKAQFYPGVEEKYYTSLLKGLSKTRLPNVMADVEVRR